MVIGSKCCHSFARRATVFGLVLAKTAADVAFISYCCCHIIDSFNFSKITQAFDAHFQFAFASSS